MQKLQRIRVHHVPMSNAHHVCSFCGAAAAHLQQLRQLSMVRTSGTGMLSRSNYLLQQGYSVLGCRGLHSSNTHSNFHQPEPSALQYSFLPAVQQLPPQYILAQQTSTTFILSTANPPIHYSNACISCLSLVPTRLHKQILDGNYTDLALLIMPSLQQPPVDCFLESQNESILALNMKKPYSFQKTHTSRVHLCIFPLQRRPLLTVPLPASGNGDYMAIILNLTLCFSGNRFYQYHIHLYLLIGALLTIKFTGTFLQHAKPQHKALPMIKPPPLGRP